MEKVSCLKESGFLKKSLLLFLLISSISRGVGQIYLHNFGTTAISAHPYTVAPPTFDVSLNGSSWSNSTNAWTSFAGSAGQAIALNNSSGTPTITLTFNVASGYQLSITSFNFWRQRSASGAQNWSMTINGISVGNGTVPTTGAALGATTVTNAITNLTGTITVVISLSGASGTGTFRLDDFTLNGTVNPIAVTPTITVSPATLTGLNYILGSGPSAEQTFTCSGVSLSYDISLTAPANYEISTTSGSGFSSSITLTHSSGVVASTTIYVRLKTGLSAGTYNGEIIDVTSSGATSKTITCSGSVTVVVTGVFINEILVNPSDGNDGSNAPNTSEWVELYNSTGASVDISCWFITDGDFAVTFPSGSTIASGGYFTIASASGSGLSPNLDWALCGCTSGAGSEVGIFTNSAEQVVLYDAAGNLMDAIIWGGGQLPDGITRGATGSCSAVTVNFPGSGSFENIGTVSDGVMNERDTDGSSTWQQTATGTFAASNGTVVLPIELISFNGKFNGINANDLYWSTASETNNDFFTLEKSTNGISFSEIAKVDGAGNSTTVLNYSFQDFDLQKEMSYYRLKQTDLNGSTSYSRIISINSEKDNGLHIFPNPVQNELTIQFNNHGESFAYEIINLQGMIVKKDKQSSNEVSDYKIDIAELAAGTYILRSYSGKATTQKLFIKN